MSKQILVMIEAVETITLKQGCRTQRLEKGDWTILTEAQVAVVLKKARSRVRIVGRREFGPASRNASPLSPVYWQRRSGQIDGPGTVDPFVSAKDGLWLVIEQEGEWIWVHREALRSRQEFEQQQKTIRRP